MTSSTDRPDLEPTTAEADEPRPTPGINDKGRVKRTRAGAWWTALVLVALVSLVFLVFIAQNAESVTIRFLSYDGELSLAVALLLSAAVGALVVAIPGMVRIAQLRRSLRRTAKSKH
ncbi:hypothetical protein ASD11_17045 [Aeromicrobium sp. Root495]|nr:hypothetical protein ASD11_17045 [Aeromicrobium sp. Root495]